MSKPLDMKKPFGVVAPPGSAGGAHYYQDGRYFDSGFQPIKIDVPAGDSPRPAQPEPVVRQARAPAPTVVDEDDAVVDDDGDGDADDDGVEVMASPALDEPEVDWTALSNRPFFSFRAAVKQHYGVTINSRQEGVDFLREQGIKV